MPDLNALVVFARVVDANGFSAAARQLSMPVSTVSRKVADLETQLGVRLIERSTRSLRLTEIGSDVLVQARRMVELAETIDNEVSNQRSEVRGQLRISAPPSISDSILVPILSAFQAAYPDVRVNVLITDRVVEHISEGIDVAFRVGRLHDSALVARTLLRYRHQLVASPEYVKRSGQPDCPRELAKHRLYGFSFWTNEHQWTFQRNGEQETIQFVPHLVMNDYAGLACALLEGRGIGDLPPVVAPHLIASGALIEVMPEWTFRPLDLSIVHVGGRQIPRQVRLFKEMAGQLATTLFPRLPD
jgi:DNA-binding transcriptional LysR family regulator